MRDIARRSFLASISAIPAATVAAALPLAVLAHPAAAAAQADANLIAQAARVMRLARLKDQAGGRLTRRQEAVMDAQPPRPKKPAEWPNSCTIEDHEPDTAAGIERVLTATFRKPMGEHALAERAYAEAVAAYEADCARLQQLHGIDGAEDLNDNLMDSLTESATTLAAMPAVNSAGRVAKARAYLALVETHGWWSDAADDWISQLATSIARDALTVGGQANV